ncbi:TPA: hypothetical protein NEG48_001091 [Elizabethkingia anophelis]|nr:hypothetical protein [Elizabethkingia anophelis]
MEKHGKGGRKPKTDPCSRRLVFYLSEADYARFLSLYEKSGVKVKAHFITACIFERPIKTIKVDKTAQEYYTKLTELYGQFRAVGVNYNQIVKQLHASFSEKKARYYLNKLEQETIQLATIGNQILQLNLAFEKYFLDNNK